MTTKERATAIADMHIILTQAAASDTHTVETATGTYTFNSGNIDKMLKEYKRNLTERRISTADRAYDNRVNAGQRLYADLTSEPKEIITALRKILAASEKTAIQTAKKLIEKHDRIKHYVEVGKRCTNYYHNTYETIVDYSNSNSRNTLAYYLSMIR